LSVLSRMYLLWMFKFQLSEDVSGLVLTIDSGATIIPVLSAIPHTFTDAERDVLIQRIQFGGDEVVKAKDGTGMNLYSHQRLCNSFDGICRCSLC
jgi:malate/lactate dehydrogenase